MEIFDTEKDWQSNLKIKDVCLASSNAPVVFETPTTIYDADGQEYGQYVDGGISGNCPLEVAIPRLQRIFEDENSRIETVVSLAPPPKVCFHTGFLYLNLLRHNAP